MERPTCPGARATESRLWRSAGSSSAVGAAFKQAPTCVACWGGGVGVVSVCLSLVCVCFSPLKDHKKKPIATKYDLAKNMQQLLDSWVVFFFQGDCVG